LVESPQLREADEQTVAKRGGLLAWLDSTTALLQAPAGYVEPSRGFWSRLFG